MAYTLVPTELIVDGAITSAKLDTNIAISGTLGVTGEFTLATHLIMGDNDKIKIGTGGDLEIYHDGSNSYISNSTGNIYLGDTNGAVHIQAKLNEESIICAADGAVTLYHDNSPKLATSSAGVTVTGTLAATLSTAAQPNITSLGTLTGLTTTGDINFGDNDKAVFGAGSDLQIYHDGTDTWIDESGAGSLKIRGNYLQLLSPQDELFFQGQANGSSYIYHNGLEKLATTSTGIDVTGGVNAYNFAADNSITIDNSSGYAALEMGGSSGAFIDLKNPSSDDYDLRLITFGTGGQILSTGAIELKSSSNTNQLYLNTDGNVGIGTSTPDGFYSGAQQLVVHRASGLAGITVSTANNTTGALYFADGTTGSQAYMGGIAYAHATDVLTLVSGGAARVNVATAGHLYPNVNNTMDLGLTDKRWKDLYLSNELNITANNTQLAASLENSNAAGYGLRVTTYATGAQYAFAVDSYGGGYSRDFTIGADGNVNVLTGNLLVGTTSAASGFKLQVDGGAGNARYTNIDTGGSTFDQFRFNDGLVGSITTNGVTTAFNTSSDARLKENVDYDFTALDRVAQLKPARFNFIADADTTVDGFLAHEVQDIVPEAVTGEKDAVKEEEYEITPAVLDDDGNVVTEAEMGTREVPEYQGIDQSKLVPLLTKAIQEQQTIIDDLKSRIETLEG